MNMDFKKGFTLIEIMVAITIIGVVFGVIITSAGAIQRNSRDTKRKSDLSNIQGALEQYHADAGYYPYNLPSSGSFKSDDGQKTYLQNVPVDPQTSNPYKYDGYTNDGLTLCVGPSDCVNYCLYADLENTPTQDPSTTCTPPAGYNYYVTQP
ncbi:prepilin-type N-terminal cleavage/methylation domain-containing protein [Candidatus Daviesbacteria bacterium]|nr:prepilin-type N-terminal cleavage/methylation domain-containing protein [Candidatus Daviesbacteria bacterium]